MMIPLAQPECQHPAQDFNNASTIQDNRPVVVEKEQDVYAKVPFTILTIYIC